jgi:hypothetical protein
LVVIAILIHERRCYYRDNLRGKPIGEQDIEQVWFGGVHSDVGGSYEEKESGLSKIALEWMLVEAMKAGLIVQPTKVSVILTGAPILPPVPGLPHYAKPDENSCLHTSLHGLWWVFELLPHRNPHRHGKRW